jgi:hypothetical protein
MLQFCTHEVSVRQLPVTGTEKRATFIRDPQSADGYALVAIRLTWGRDCAESARGQGQVPGDGFDRRGHGARVSDLHSFCAVANACRLGAGGALSRARRRARR